jgi:hypothetical protein
MDGVKTFDVSTDPDFGKPPGLVDAPQHMDNGSTNEANQITSAENPWAVQQNTQPAAAQAAAAPEDTSSSEIARLKKIVGDQGNTIGDLRKLLGSLSQRAASQPAQGYVPQQPVRLFQNREPNDYPTAAEIQNALVYAGDVLMNSFNQRIEEMAVQAQLSQAGVTPEEAALIRLEFPSLPSLSPAERSAVIGALIKTRRSEASTATAAEVTRTSQTAQAGVRQQVYVPQTQPVSSIPQSGAQINVDAFGNLKDAAQMEKALASLGAGRVQDFHRRG